MTEYPLTQEDLDLLSESHYYATDANGEIKFYNILVKLDFTDKKNLNNKKYIRIKIYDVLTGKMFSSEGFNTYTVARMLKILKNETNNENTFKHPKNNLTYYITK